MTDLGFDLGYNLGRDLVAGASAIAQVSWYADITSDSASNTEISGEIDVFDNAGSGNDFTAANSGRRPDTGGPSAGGHPAATFSLSDGIDSGVAADWGFLGSSSTLIWVMNPTSGNQGVLWDCGLALAATNGPGVECFAWWSVTDTGKIRVRASDGSAWVATATAPAGSCSPGSVSVLSVLVGDDASDDIVIRVNGSEVATATKTSALSSGTPPSFFRASTGVSGSGGTQMEFYRLLIANERLPLSTLASVEAELATEYGI